MSTSFAFYLVDGPSVVSACGSKDQTLVDRILSDFAREMEEFDQATGDDSGTGGLAESIRGLIDGQKLPVDYDGRAVGAYELICRHIGEWVSAEHFQDSSIYVFDEIDRALAALGLDEQVSGSHLLERGAIEGVPIDWNDMSSYGYLTRDEVKAAIELLPNGDTSAAHDLADTEPETAEAVEELLEIAAKAAREGKYVVVIAQ